jgi:hypothetical protein
MRTNRYRPIRSIHVSFDDARCILGHLVEIFFHKLFGALEARFFARRRMTEAVRAGDDRVIDAQI